MEEWGNGRANAYWEANLPPHVHKPKEGDTVRTIEKFIRDKYEHKRYVASSVPERTSSAAPAAAASAPASTNSSAKAAPANNNNGNHGRGFVYDDEEPETAPAAAPARRAAPQSAAAPAPVAAKPVAAPVDLLNFLDEPAAPSPATVTSNGSSPFAPTAASSVFGFEATQAAPQAHAQHDAFGGDFSAFQSAPAQQQGHQQAQYQQQGQGQAPQQAQFSNGFGFDSFGPQDSLTAPVPVAAAPQAAPARPLASADSILSLFAAPAPAYGHAQQYPPQGGIYSPHQAASPYGMPPQHQQQQGFYPQQQGYGQQSASPFPGQGASPFPGQAASPFPGAASPYSPYPQQGGYPQQPAQGQGQYGQNGYGQPQGQGQGQGQAYPPQQQQQFNQFPQNGWR